MPEHSKSNAAKPSRIDVSKKAEVSLQSVIDFYAPGRVRSFGEETLAKILWALSETGYEYSPRPSAELRGKSVLYELPRLWPYDSTLPGQDDSHDDHLHSNIVWSAVIAGLSRSVGQAGARLEVFANLAALNLPARFPSTERFLQLGRDYVESTATHAYERAVKGRPRKSIGGFILIDPREDDPRIDWLDESRFPFVVLGRPPGGSDMLPQVDIDDEWGFEQLVVGLRSLGIDPDRIGHVGFQDDGTGPPARRKRGVLRGLGLAKAPLRGRNGGATGGGVDGLTFEIPYGQPFDDLQIAELGAWLARNQWHAVVADCDRFATFIAGAAARVGLAVDIAPGSGKLVLAGCDDSAERRSSPVAWMTLKTPVTKWCGAGVDLLAQQQPESPRRGTRPQAPCLIKPHVLPGTVLETDTIPELSQAEDFE